MLLNLIPDHQRLADWQHELSLQDVELGGWPRAVSHNQVGHGELLPSKFHICVWWEVCGVIIALLQEGFNAFSLFQDHR